MKLSPEERARAKVQLLEDFYCPGTEGHEGGTSGESVQILCNRCIAVAFAAAEAEGRRAAIEDALDVLRANLQDYGIDEAAMREVRALAGAADPKGGADR